MNIYRWLAEVSCLAGTEDPYEATHGHRPPGKLRLKPGKTAPDIDKDIAENHKVHCRSWLTGAVIARIAALMRLPEISADKADEARKRMPDVEKRLEGMMRYESHKLNDEFYHCVWVKDYWGARRVLMKICNEPLTRLIRAEKRGAIEELYAQAASVIRKKKVTRPRRRTSFIIYDEELYEMMFNHATECNTHFSRFVWDAALAHMRRTRHDAPHPVIEIESEAMEDKKHPGISARLKPGGE